MPAGWPEIPVRVRMIFPGTTDYYASAWQEKFSRVKAFYETYGISLSLTTVLVPDDPDHVAQNDDQEWDASERYWTPGQTWLNVLVCFLSFGADTLRSDNGLTVHAKVSVERARPPILLKWNTRCQTLAHELGHMMGLPHANEPVYGGAFAPFGNDVDPADSENLMQSLVPTPLGDEPLTRNQVLRMRLTLLTQRQDLWRTYDLVDSSGQLSFYPFPQTAALGALWTD